MEVAVFAGPCSAGQQLDDSAAVWGTPDAGRRVPAWGTPDGAARWGWDLAAWGLAAWGRGGRRAADRGAVEVETGERGAGAGWSLVGRRACAYASPRERRRRWTAAVVRPCGTAGGGVTG